MSVLIAIALKSLLVAGLTLGLLTLMKRRSAAERSWVAHVGLLALVIMAFAPLALPRWTVEAPALLGQAPTPNAPTTTVKSGSAGNPGRRGDAGRRILAPCHQRGGRGIGRLRYPCSDPVADHRARARPPGRLTRPR